MRTEPELGGSLFDRDRVDTRLTSLGNLLRLELEQINRYAAKAKRKAEVFLTGRSAKNEERSEGRLPCQLMAALFGCN